MKTTLFRRLTKATFALSLFGCARTTPPAAAVPEASPDSGPDSDAGAATPVIDAAAPVAPADAEAPLEAPASHAENDFTLRMLKALRTEKGNLFFSGESLRGALGMTALGAKATTLGEMAKTLGVDADPSRNAAAARASGEAWKAAAGSAELAIANRLWVAEKFPIEKAFLENAERGYGASAAPTDFAKAPEPSRVKINAWVSDATKGKIKDLLPRGAVTDLTRVVLTNAIYFKGTWAAPFDTKATKSEPFETATGPVPVPTMHRSADMLFGETDGVKVVQLPYRDSALAMLVVLPPKGDGPAGLAAVEASLGTEQLRTWTASLRSSRVALALPKFTFAWGRSVKRELADLGIHDAFDAKAADFSGLAPVPAAASGGLFVTDVFHKAFILVDEVGTEAAAATGVVVGLRSLPRTHEMKVDRPFLFFVLNTKTGEILFSGRVANPKT